MRIFLIDDSKSALAALCRAIKDIDECVVQTFLDPRDALESVTVQPPDLILVDYLMPQMDGVELIRCFRAKPMTAHTPIIMITSDTDATIKLAAMCVGATEFLNKPFDNIELNIRVRNLLDIRRERKAIAKKARELESDFHNAVRSLEQREEEIIFRLSRAIGCRDGETGAHLDRVAMIAKMIAEQLGFEAEQARMIFLASPLHDVGKIGVPDSILRKPGRFTPEERMDMCKHTDFGAEILSGSTSNVIKVAERIAAAHHEKWDGTGYPLGLTGDEIPLEARIVAVADVFDALCSERPYKKAWPIDLAFEEIYKGSGTHFDPDCVRAFRELAPVVRTLIAHPSGEANDEIFEKID